MSRASQIQWEINQLHGLLADVEDSEISRLQIESRIQWLQDDLRAATGELFPPAEPIVPQAAVFLVGDAMNGRGIEAALAGEVLHRYEKMFREQAMHDERTARKNRGHQRRLKGTQEPSLLLTGTPRGSFGFQFSPSLTDAETQSLQGQSLKNVAAAVSLVSDPEMAPENISEKLPRGMLSHIVAFFKALASNNVALRFAFQDQPSSTITADMIRNASAKLERKIEIEEFKVRGRPRGATMESGHFDFVKEDKDGDVTISGMLDEQLDDEDRKQIIQCNDQPVDAIIELTTVTLVGDRDEFGADGMG